MKPSPLRAASQQPIPLLTYPCHDERFPVTRLRRLRRTDTLRALVRETRLSLDDVVMPLFACPGRASCAP